MSFKEFEWLNAPKDFDIKENAVTMKTEPVTDFWQRTYYGFRHNNAHALLTRTDDQEFSFFVKTEMKPNKLFDQCGILVYLDEDNWAKASCEFENEGVSHMGGVVTNDGYSDWAAFETDNRACVYYRVSRRGKDFEIRYSFDGETFHFLRIFHLNHADDQIRIGVYGCTPLINSVECTFSEMRFTECQWALYENPDEKEAE